MNAAPNEVDPQIEPIEIAPDEFWELAPPLRHRPLSEEEVAQIKQLCRQSIPGPFVVGDAADGEDRLVAMLADGRPLVSRGLALGEPIEPEAIEATLRLFCRARHLLLHLLAERESLRQRCDSLQQRCGELAQQVKALSGQIASGGTWSIANEALSDDESEASVSAAPRHPR